VVSRVSRFVVKTGTRSLSKIGAAIFVSNETRFTRGLVISLMRGAKEAYFIIAEGQL
jgi:hypothetical protein